MAGVEGGAARNIVAGGAMMAHTDINLYRLPLAADGMIQER